MKNKATIYLTIHFPSDSILGKKIKMFIRLYNTTMTAVELMKHASQEAERKALSILQDSQLKAFSITLERVSRINIPKYSDQYSQ